jgi:hypothetical protein
VVLYGKALTQVRPQWAKVIYLNQLHQYGQQERCFDRPDQGGTPREHLEQPTTAILAASNLELAQQGQPDAIAHHLSEVLHQQGIAVQAKVKPVSPADQDQATPRLCRLLVQCGSTYSPDPTQLADLIAPRLRQLELRGFRDAIVVGTVHGEREADWLLCIDLTPLEEMLRQWARWGDVPALMRLMNLLLAPHHLQVAGMVLDRVLHLTCWALYQGGHPELEAPPQTTVLQVLLPLLETLEPQGLEAACFYSSSVPFHPTPQSPYPDGSDWIYNCTLSAISPCDRSPTTEQLAQAGNFEALTYLLNRCLNRDLERRLTTGGLRVQIRGREDLLHLMVDGPTLPSPRPVVKALAHAVRSLAIPAVNGIRIYGRQSGQSRPQWQEAIDFVVRHRLVPEATPEFAASEAYVADLIRQQAHPFSNFAAETASGAGAMPADTQTASPLQQLWATLIDRLRASCLGSSLFVPAQPEPLLPRPAEATSPSWQEDGKVALVWVALGALVTVCGDWGLGALLSPPPSAPRVAPTPAPQELSWSGLVLNRSSTNPGHAFNSAGFTGQHQTLVSMSGSSALHPSQTDDAALQGVKLPASTLQARATPNLSQSPYLSFDTPQLDKKLALYQEYVARTGVPDVLIVGSSRALRGLDPVALQGALAAQGLSKVRIFNFGINGSTAQVVDLIVRRLIPAQQLPKLIIWADGARAFNSNRTDFTFKAMVASPGYAQLPQKPATGSAAPSVLTTSAESWQGLHQEVADRYRGMETSLQAALAGVSFTYSQRDALVGIVRDGWLAQGWSPSAATERAMAQVNPALEGIDVNGFLPLAIRFNPITYYQTYARVAGASDADYTAFQLQGQQTNALQRLCTYLKQHRSELVFVNLPLTAEYLDADRRTYEAQFQQSMIRWAKAYGFTYRNLAERWQTQWNYFSDPSHLNRYGAYVVAQQLAQDALIPWSR